MPDVFANITGAPPQALEMIEAKRRAETNTFFGYMAYASMVGRKPQ
jgi:hypothetical protein